MKILLIFVLIALIISCSKNSDTPEESTALFEISISSSGDFMNYDSAINVNAVGSAIKINSDIEVKDVILFRLDGQSNNRFNTIAKATSIAIRLSLGEPKIDAIDVLDSSISVAVKKNGSLVQEVSFVVKPDNERNVITLEYQAE